MDGTNRTRLVDYNIEQPTAVAVDVVKKLVYWADAYLDYIDVVDYHGRNRHTIVHGSQVSITFQCEQRLFCLPWAPRHEGPLWTYVSGNLNRQFASVINTLALLI